MAKPIKPSEVAKAKHDTFPDFVFEAFNKLITQNYTHGSAEVTQDAVIDEILRLTTDKNPGYPVSRETIFESGWLNVEEAYAAEGWAVDYDKPGYNETYRAFFTFTKKG